MVETIMDKARSLSSVFKSDMHLMASTLARSREQVSFWFDMIEKFIRNQPSGETQKAYLFDLKQFFTWAEKNGVGDFKDINLKKAIEYRDYLKSFGGRKTKGGLSEAANTTVGRKICALSSFFEFVAKEIQEKTNTVVVNPFKRVERLKIDSSATVTEALIKEELAKLMDYINALTPTLMNLRDKAIIKTLFGVVTRNRAFINLKGKDFYAFGDRFKLKIYRQRQQTF